MARCSISGHYDAARPSHASLSDTTLRHFHYIAYRKSPLRARPHRRAGRRHISLRNGERCYDYFAKLYFRIDRFADDGQYDIAADICT